MKRFVPALALALLVPASLHASDAPAQAAPAEAATAKAAAPRAPAAKVKCPCTQPRLLSRGRLVLDGTSTVSAWLHLGARLEPYAKAQPGAPPQGVSAPILRAALDVSPFGAPVPSSSALVRAGAGGAFPEPFLLGVLRAKESTPKDVLEVSLAPPADGPPALPPPGPPPVLSALWITALEQRDRPGCGPWLTHRVAFEAAPGSPPVEGLLVSTESSSGRKAALVDVRTAGIFGLGRVEACDEGMPFVAGEPVRVEVRPVSSSHGVGEAWAFDSDGTGVADPRRAATPSSVDEAAVARPFPRPGDEELRRFDLKPAVVAVMGGLVALAAALAGLFWIVIPKRRRKLREFPCPTCEKPIPIDLLDPDTDGVMCPSCGQASVWKGGDTSGADERAKVTRLP